MNNRLIKTRRRLRKKIDAIQDEDYLASLDAILTFESIPIIQNENWRCRALQTLRLRLKQLLFRD
jgi:hypothetical protein